MTIEKTMIIPLALCIFVLVASGIIIDRQVTMQAEHENIKKEIAGMLKECRVQPSE